MLDKNDRKITVIIKMTVLLRDNEPLLSPQGPYIFRIRCERQMTVWI